jgi:predicted nicotinamide N-methyase
MATHTHPLLSGYLDGFGSPGPDPLCPELRAWNTRDFNGLWKRARSLDENAPVPYWGIVWPGGRGMARFILDNKKLFRKKRVLDVGTGSGITAVAAAKAGARVTGIDIDPAAIELAAMTAEANEARCVFRQAGVDDISDEALKEFDIIIAGDIFNAREFAGGMIELVRRGLRAGLRNFLSDSGRSHRPRHGTEILCAMRVPVFREIEGVSERDVKIFCMTG